MNEIYQAPAVEIIEVAVEGGIANSGPDTPRTSINGYEDGGEF